MIGKVIQVILRSTFAYIILLVLGRLIGRLKSTKHDERWIREQLKLQKVNSVKEVFYAGLRVNAKCEGKVWYGDL